MAKYDASSIKVLKGLTPIRKRPGMFVGSTGKQGVYRLFREILDNGVDEYQAGHANKIYIWWNEDSIWIGDNGRGIPVEKHPEEKISTLILLFTMTHAGGKFDNKTYKISSGLHGVGMKATNALSEWLKVYTKRKGKWYYQEFLKGIPKNTPKNVKTPKFKGAENLSTIIGFSPDTSIMSTKTVSIKKMFEEIEYLSYLCPKLVFKIFYKGKKKVFKTVEGIKEYVDKTYKSSYHKDTFYASDKEGKYEIALKWTNEEAIKINSYVNCSYTNEGGTHVKGMERGIVSVLKRYVSKDNIDTEDLRAGVCGILHIKMSDPIYRGQTKNELTNKDTEKEVFDFVKSELDVFFKKYPGIVNNIVKRAKILANARDKANFAKQALKEVKIGTKGKIGELPDKLVAAPYCSNKVREVFICEGESAGGSIKQARDKHFQEILPLRGKIPNAIKKKAVDILANEEISDINTSVGTHVGQKCRIKNCRYDKIMILTDADPDGKHIAALLIAYFGKYMPDVIRHGKLYVVKSPLFKGYYKNKYEFGFTISDVRSKFPKGAQIQISRLKGHGEADPGDVERYAVSPKTRKLIKVKWNGSTMSKINQILGNDTSYRKELLGV